MIHYIIIVINNNIMNHNRTKTELPAVYLHAPYDCSNVNNIKKERGHVGLLFYIMIIANSVASFRNILAAVKVDDAIAKY